MKHCPRLNKHSVYTNIGTSSVLALPVCLDQELYIHCTVNLHNRHGRRDGTDKETPLFSPGNLKQDLHESYYRRLTQNILTVCCRIDMDDVHALWICIML